MKCIPILFGLLALSSAPLHAEDLAQKPATKLEAFQAKTGLVIIRGYTTVGSLTGTNANIAVDAREFRDASNPATRVTGVSIEVKESSRLERQNTSFIDADEIDSLLQGLDYISKATQSVTAHRNFEIEYRTKGEFAVTVFNDRTGQLSAVVSSGRIGKVSAYVELEQLAHLRALIVAAKGKL